MFCWVLGSFFLYDATESGTYESLDSDGQVVVRLRTFQVWRIMGGDAPVAEGPGDVSVEPDHGDRHWTWYAGWIVLSIGIALLVKPLLWTIRWVRFGRSVFEMEHGPGVIGGMLKGTIRPGKKLGPKDGCQIKLSFSWMEREYTFWQVSETDSHRSAIPVSFQIPSEVVETTPPHGIGWQLKATATAPGVNYKATFDVPVFRTADSPPPQPPESFDSESEADWQQHNMSIQVNPTVTGGKEFVFANGHGNIVCRAILILITLGSFSLFWVSVFQVLSAPAGHGDLPIELVITFLASATLPQCFAIPMFWFWKYRVRVEDETVTVSSGVPGWSRTRMIPVSQIESIDAEIAVSWNMCSNGYGYTIYIKQRDGRKLAASRCIPALDTPSPEFAIWLAAEMWRCVAEKAQPQEQAMEADMLEPDYDMSYPC